MANLKSLEKRLTGNVGVPCKILVDLLLCNGNNFNRFVKFFFDGNNIDRASIKITKLNQFEEKDVNEFYKKNRTIIKNGVLTPSEYLKYVN